MHRWIRGLFASATLGLLAACGGGGGDSSSNGVQSGTATNLAEAMKTSGSTNTMAGAVATAGMTEAMRGTQTYTLLMPSDEAMAPYAEELAELNKPENKAALEQYVKAHMVDGKLLADKIAAAATAPDTNAATTA